ncbi:Holliday junction resolvase RuvX [Thiobacillus sedimenti]|uniref:Putative pre-16S rRNA nuclease n=1 Tax=Thiobacillus sedimenti TaxID=3110231 RepID=A0ABZ1CI41_9PROT|nr:Holliday junction resolvase RuvX [Thiobacillus sp. SCUT-2]WRS39058.1 Holliday junction resolvase RuvX [Thiobacillus sp. SCUT-2]
MSYAETHGTVLGFDLGLKRTGVASGELSLGIAHPLTVVQADSTDARLAAIARLVDEWKPVLLVLGLPTHADGTEHEMTRVAKNFARKLESRFNLPVFLVDERHTSTEAESELHARGIHGRKNKALADAVAAQLILQGFFDARLTA